MWGRKLSRLWLKVPHDTLLSHSIHLPPLQTRSARKELVMIVYATKPRACLLLHRNSIFYLNDKSNIHAVWALKWLWNLSYHIQLEGRTHAKCFFFQQILLYLIDIFGRSIYTVCYFTHTSINVYVSWDIKMLNVLVKLINMFKPQEKFSAISRRKNMYLPQFLW